MKSLLELSSTRRFAFCLEANTCQLVFSPTYDLRPSALMFQPVPVIGINHWAVEMNSVSATHEGKTTSRCVDGQKCVAIIDSGTSLIGVPPNAVNFVFEIIQQIKYDCSNLDKLPDLVIDLGGHKFAMPPSAYVVQLGEAGGKATRCLPAFTDFAMTSDQGTVWILGMPFLRHFYTIFDREEPSLYVAEQGDDCEPAAPKPTASKEVFFSDAFSTLRSKSAFAAIFSTICRKPGGKRLQSMGIVCVACAMRLKGGASFTWNGPPCLKL